MERARTFGRRSRWAGRRGRLGVVVRSVPRVQLLVPPLLPWIRPAESRGRWACAGRTEPGPEELVLRTAGVASEQVQRAPGEGYRGCRRHTGSVTTWSGRPPDRAAHRRTAGAAPADGR